MSTVVVPSPRKNLSITGLIEKSALSSDDPLIMLVEFHIVDRFNGQVEQVVRVANVGQTEANPSTYTNSAGGITYKGVYFQPAAFEVNVSEAAGEIPEISFSMNDLTGVVRGYMENYHGGVGSFVKVILLFQSTLDLPIEQQAAEYQETYTITSSSIDSMNVRLGLGAKDLLAVKFPKRLQIAHYCQWGYKTVECGYSGSNPTCDRTLQGANGCATHDNTINFGGFPGIRGRSVIR